MEYKVNAGRLRIYHELGFTNSQMATEFEVDSSTITYWMEKLGLRANESLKNHVFNEKVALKLYYQGFSDRQIAKALKIHFNTANRWRTRSKLQANGHVIMEKRVGNYIIRTHARDKIVLDPSIIA